MSSRVVHSSKTPTRIKEVGVLVLVSGGITGSGRTSSTFFFELIERMARRILDDAVHDELTLSVVVFV